MCNYCERIDTLERHLIQCTASEQIWEGIADSIRNNLLIIYHFTECDLLFGIAFTNSIDLQIINFMILSPNDL